MSSSQERLADYLAHIVEAIDRISQYTGAVDKASFLKDQLVQDAVIRNLEIVGEASNNSEALPRFRCGARRTTVIVCLSNAQRHCSRLLQGGL